MRRSLNERSGATHWCLRTTFMEIILSSDASDYFLNLIELGNEEKEDLLTGPGFSVEGLSPFAEIFK